jgi:hypothetical protein
MIESLHEFSAFMDPTVMKELLQQRLPECKAGAWKLDECRIQHPRYKTYLRPESRGKAFLSLAYHLTGKNQSTGQAESKILYAQAYLGKRSAFEFQKALAEAGAVRKKLILHIPELGLVAWTFPHDPALIWLPTLTEPMADPDYFSSLWQLAQTANAKTPVSISVDVVNYRPRLRCTLRYLLHDSAGRQSAVYGKTYVDQRGAEIYRRLTTLRQQSLVSVRSFVIARPLAYDAALHVLWQDGVTGKPLLEPMITGNPSGLIKAIAEGLAHLHRSQFPDLDNLTPDYLLAEANKKSAKLLSAFPQFSQLITGIIARLGQHRPHPDMTPGCLIHGDFHVQQLLLLHTGRIALFDFDELALGDPLHDVANFCADLYNQHFNRQQVQSITVQLADAYSAASGTKTDFARFDWHLRLQLLTRAYRAYIQQKPDLEQQVHGLLEAAEYGYFVDR